MQDQNHISAVQIHHQYIHHAALSSESPAAVLQAQSSMPLTGAAAPPAWSTGGGPSCLPTAIVDYGALAATTTSLVLDNSELDVTPSTAAFQQLLDSFGSQSDDDVDDDTVVSLDESVSQRARHVGLSTHSFKKHYHHQQQILQSIVQPQQHVVCSAARC